MKRLAFSLVVVLMLVATGDARAQRPVRQAQAKQTRIAAAQSRATTPEMWFYQQEMLRYEDPWVAVRRKAEFRADQRQRRIAAMKWYGYSNARPVVNSTPWGSSYSPYWSSNTVRPNGWGLVYPTILVHESP